MSGTLAAQRGAPSPTIPRPITPAAQDARARADVWKGNFFRARGWKSKTAQNEALKGTLEAAAANLIKPGGPDSAAALAAEGLDPGSDFKAYLKCLATFEQLPEATTASALKAASLSYIAHYQKHSDREKTQKKTLRKFQACQKTADDAELWLKLDEVGGLPWDSTSALKAATVKAELDFASLPLGGQTAQSLDGKGVNPTFWVNRAGADPSKPDKTYLFKPATDKSDRMGVPLGGEPAREALTGRAAEILNGMTGIDFKVPETHIVKVERKRFDGIALSKQVMDHDGAGPLVGSLQQFAESQGELRDNSPTLARAVPPERCQDLAILDIVTMHVDRHSGNFMINGDESRADLVPIDNGLSFPDKPSALSYMATSHNALLRLPGSHKPFTPETLKKIAKINPAALKAALRSEINDIEAVHPSAAGKVADAALEQSRRSAMFLKLAAPTLTPAAVQVALGQNAERLFSPAITDDAAFAALAAQIIAAIAPQQAQLAEYFQMSMLEHIRLEDECARLGWDTRNLAPIQILKVFKSKVQQPQAPKFPTGGGQATDQEQADMRLAFPNAPKFSSTYLALNIDSWRALALTGTPAGIRAAVERAAGKMSASSEKQGALISIRTALDVLRAQAAADAVPPVAAAAGKGLLLDSKRDLIKDLAAMLSGPVQAQVSQRADTLRAGGHEDGLDVLRDKVAGAVRDILLKEHGALMEKVKKLLDGPIQQAALRDLGTAEKQIRNELNLTRAKELIDGVKLK